MKEEGSGYIANDRINQKVQYETGDKNLFQAKLFTFEAAGGKKEMSKENRQKTHEEQDVYQGHYYSHSFLIQTQANDQDKVYLIGMEK